MLWLCRDLHNGFYLLLGSKSQKQDSQHQSYSPVPRPLVQELIEKGKKEKNLAFVLSDQLSRLKLTWSAAFNVRISCVTWSTSANASVIAGFTISIGSTVTGIHTLLIATSKSCGTFWVSQTLIGPTLYIWTAFVAWWTLALGSVPVHSAEGFDSTLLIGTRILTLSLDASLSEWALIITLTTSYTFKKKQKKKPVKL